MNRAKNLIHLRPCLSPVLMINTVSKEGLMQSGLKPIFINDSNDPHAFNRSRQMLWVRLLLSSHLLFQMR